MVKSIPVICRDFITAIFRIQCSKFRRNRLSFSVSCIICSCVKIARKKKKKKKGNRLNNIIFQNIICRFKINRIDNLYYIPY